MKFLNLILFITIISNDLILRINSQQHTQDQIHGIVFQNESYWNGWSTENNVSEIIALYDHVNNLVFYKDLSVPACFIEDGIVAGQNNKQKSSMSQSLFKVLSVSNSTVELEKLKMSKFLSDFCEELPIFMIKSSDSGSLRRVHRNRRRKKRETRNENVLNLKDETRSRAVLIGNQDPVLARMNSKGFYLRQVQTQGGSGSLGQSQAQFGGMGRGIYLGSGRTGSSQVTLANGGTGTGYTWNMRMRPETKSSDTVGHYSNTAEYQQTYPAEGESNNYETSYQSSTGSSSKIYQNGHQSKNGRYTSELTQNGVSGNLVDGALTGQTNGISGHSVDGVLTGQTNGISGYSVSRTWSSQTNGVSGHQDSGALTDQVNGVSGHSINGVRKSQVNGVSGHSINGVRKSQVNGVSGHSINGVRTSQVNGVAGHSVNGFRTSQTNGAAGHLVGGMSTGQANGVSLHSVNGVSTDHANTGSDKHYGNKNEDRRMVAADGTGTTSWSSSSQYRRTSNGTPATWSEVVQGPQTLTQYTSNGKHRNNGGLKFSVASDQPQGVQTETFSGIRPEDTSQEYLSEGRGQKFSRAEHSSVKTVQNGEALVLPQNLSGFRRITVQTGAVNSQPMNGHSVQFVQNRQSHQYAGGQPVQSGVTSKQSQVVQRWQTHQLEHGGESQQNGHGSQVLQYTPGWQSQTFGLKGQTQHSDIIDHELTSVKIENENGQRQGQNGESYQSGHVVHSSHAVRNEQSHQNGRSGQSHGLDYDENSHQLGLGHIEQSHEFSQPVKSKLPEENIRQHGETHLTGQSENPQVLNVQFQQSRSRNYSQHWTQQGQSQPGQNIQDSTKILNLQLTSPIHTDQVHTQKLNNIHIQQNGQTGGYSNTQQNTHNGQTDSNIHSLALQNGENGYNRNYVRTEQVYQFGEGDQPQHLTQLQNEQQRLEQYQREQQREQRQKEQQQREQQQREQQQREQQQQEQQRERQLREQQLREQIRIEEQQREQVQREQLMRENQQREYQQREHMQREQQRREQIQREQQQREYALQQSQSTHYGQNTNQGTYDQWSYGQYQPRQPNGNNIYESTGRDEHTTQQYHQSNQAPLPTAATAATNQNVQNPTISNQPPESYSNQQQRSDNTGNPTQLKPQCHTVTFTCTIVNKSNGRSKLCRPVAGNIGNGQSVGSTTNQGNGQTSLSSTNQTNGQQKLCCICCC